MSSLLLFNIGELVTCKGGAKFGKDMNDIGVIKNASVLIENGKIEKVYRSALPSVKANEKIDCLGKCVVPGLIDCHTHLVFGGSREKEYEMRLKGKSYKEIMEAGGGIVSTVLDTKKESYEQLKNSAIKSLNVMLSHGVTTVEAKSGYGLDLDVETKMLEVIKDINFSPIEVIPTFLGAHAYPKEYSDNHSAYVDFVTDVVLPKVKEKNLAVFTDVFCEPTVFTLEETEKILTCAKRLGFKCKIHADEMAEYGGAGLAAKLGAVSADHLLCAKKSDLLKMKESDTVAVVLPATAFSLKEPYADARFMIDNGLCVAVASDFNPGSCFCNNISFVHTLAVRNCNLTQEEAISALTVNAAKAIGREEDLGSIEEGKQADLCVLDAPNYLFMAYNLASSCVERVFKKGKEIYRKSW